MSGPIWTPPRVIVTANGVGYLTLRPWPLITRDGPHRAIPATLVIGDSPDGSINGVEILWEPDRLNRPLL